MSDYTADVNAEALMRGVVDIYSEEERRAACANCSSGKKSGCYFYLEAINVKDK